MSAAATQYDLSTFFVCLSQSQKSTLLLDYDGTLAPFQTERERAVPYPSVPEFLEAIAENGHTRIVLISGRPAREIPPLLGLAKPPEIWGSHGLECLLPQGELRVAQPAARLNAALVAAGDALDREGLGDRVEGKTGSLAVHWRGLPQERIGEIQAATLRILEPIASAADLALLQFDGGIEMRVRRPNKGDVVQAILQETGYHDPIAFLGDDFTDEDAFAELNPFGLTVLVRKEYRPTTAQVWLRPPAELLMFLEQWLDACGGEI